MVFLFYSTRLVGLVGPCSVVLSLYFTFSCFSWSLSCCWYFHVTLFVARLLPFVCCFPKHQKAGGGIRSHPYIQSVPLSRRFAFKSWIFTAHAENKLSRGFALSRGFSHARSLHAHFRNVCVRLRSAARPNRILRMDSICVDSITAITKRSLRFLSNPYYSLEILTTPHKSWLLLANPYYSL